MTKPIKHDPLWAKAKKVCRLNMEDIRKAKELGLSPRALMKNVPSPSQKWKLPVKLWIAELHEKRFGHRRPGNCSFATPPAKLRPESAGPSQPGHTPESTTRQFETDGDVDFAPPTATVCRASR